MRAIADLIEANPDLAATPLYLRDIPLWHVLDAETLAALARAGKRHGATVEKLYGEGGYEDKFNLRLTFGAVSVKVLSYRHVVCERVVLGTDEVTRAVPDPDALAAVPTVEVTETVERVEWRCSPLLDDQAEVVS